MPPGIHAGGLRYHGMAPMVSQGVKLGIIEPVAHHHQVVARQALAAFDVKVFLVPGSDGSCRAARELMAMGKPVVTGDSPAAREVLIHGEDAILCEMANPQALAQAILLLKRNRPLREKLAREGYLSFQNKFSSQVIGATVKSYLDEVSNANVKRKT